MNTRGCLVWCGCVLLHGCAVFEPAEIHYASSGPEAGQGKIVVEKHCALGECRYSVVLDAAGARSTVFRSRGATYPALTAATWRDGGFEVLVCDGYGSPAILEGSVASRTASERQKISGALAAKIRAEYENAVPAELASGREQEWACSDEGRFAWFRARGEP